VIFATILLADGQRNLRWLADQMTATQPDLPDPKKTSRGSKSVPDQATDQQTTTSSLISTPTIEIDPLVRLDDPQERCEKLSKQGYEQVRYFKSQDFSQCTVMFIDGETEAAPSVFIQIQTDLTGKVSSFRLKFNTEGTNAEKLVQMGLNALQRFGGFVQEDENFLPTLAPRIQMWESFHLLWGHYSLAMDREVVDATRFNLLGRLQKSLSANIRQLAE